MGCYRCGAEEGNEAKLCPKCTEARIQERSAEAKAAFERPEAPSSGLPYFDGIRLPEELSDFLKKNSIRIVIPLVGIFMLTFVLNRGIGPGAGGTILKINTIGNTTGGVVRMCRENPPGMFQEPSESWCDQLERICKAGPGGQECKKMKDHVKMWQLVSIQQKAKAAKRRNSP